MSLPSLAADPPGLPSAPTGMPSLTRKQKATIIVRLLQSEGVQIALSDLPDDMQVALTEQMGTMRYISRATLQSVVSEFVEELDDLGLAFPRGVPNALDAIGENLSDSAATKIRRTAGISGGLDPWDTIGGFDNEKLLPIFEEESIEIASVAMSKLPVAKSAEILGMIPGERARRIAYSMRQTSSVAPETVRRIGEALLTQFEEEPPQAFDQGPADRVGAILNSSPAATREEVLEGLYAEDEEFGENVRKKIFTFANIRARLDKQDVPKITRDADGDLMIVAMAAAMKLEEEAKSAEYIMENMSKRMAAQMKDEIDAMGKIKASDAEAAMAHVVGIIRELAEGGEITLKEEAEDEEEEG